MPKSPLDVLYEDNHLLVVNKPAGLATKAWPKERPALLTRAKEYLKQKYESRATSIWGWSAGSTPTVSGAGIWRGPARRRTRLTAQFKSGQVEKVYWALVERPPAPAAGELSHWVLKNDRQRRMEVVAAANALGRSMRRLSYRTLGTEQMGNAR